MHHDQNATAPDLVGSRCVAYHSAYHSAPHRLGPVLFDSVILTALSINRCQGEVSDQLSGGAAAGHTAAAAPCPIGDTGDQRLAASPSAVGPVSRPLPPQRPALLRLRRGRIVPLSAWKALWPGSAGIVCGTM